MNKNLNPAGETPDATAPKLSMTIADIDLLERLVATPGGAKAARRLLQAELSRAIAVGGDDTRPYIRVGSRVTYEDFATGRLHHVTVATPENAINTNGRVSVLSPIGRALIGLPPGAVSSWVDGRGRSRELIVVDVSQA
jgi:regulator of nucleoside diphosphate kinase